MFVRALQTLTLLAVGTLVAIAIYSFANGIRSLDDFRNYRAMRSIDDPIVVAIANGTLPAGATTQDMLSIASPQWSENYGRYVVYGFTPKNSCGHQTIVTIDDRIAFAHAGSCTWQWSFFNDIPDEIVKAVDQVRGLRVMLKHNPEAAGDLQPLLDERLNLLGIPVASADTKTAPQTLPYQSMTDCPDGRSSTRPSR